MKFFILFSLLFAATPATASEIVKFNANKACAWTVGIPYASDNFTDAEWEKFQLCVRSMKYFQQRFPK